MLFTLKPFIDFIFAVCDFLVSASQVRIIHGVVLRALDRQSFGGSDLNSQSGSRSVDRSLYVPFQAPALGAYQRDVRMLKHHLSGLYETN
jgi:hypothetical protein